MYGQNWSVTRVVDVSVATGPKPKVAHVVGIHNRLASAEKAVLSVAQAWI